VSEVWQRWNAAMSRLVEVVQPAVVQVQNGRHGAGAGTVWHPDGLILTSAHVLRGRHVSVTLPDGRRLPGRVLAADTARDVAAVGIDATGLDTIALGDSRRLGAGDWVLAVGHPWGVPGAATAGVVAGAGAGLPDMPGHRREWIAVSLHLRPGHSGGPLVDVHGRLVGINTMMAGPDLGLAVPVHVVKAFLKEALGT